jgi:hypothetical protein
MDKSGATNMTLHETHETDGRVRVTEVSESPVPRRRFESRYDRATLRSLDMAAVAVAAVMTLGPLFAYAVGLGA